MKTKATLTKCPAKNTAFTQKCTNCAMIDNNRWDFLAEMHGLRDKSRRVRAKTHHDGKARGGKGTKIIC